MSNATVMDLTHRIFEWGSVVELRMGCVLLFSERYSGASDRYIMQPVGCSGNFFSMTEDPDSTQGAGATLEPGAAVAIAKAGIGDVFSRRPFLRICREYNRGRETV